MAVLTAPTKLAPGGAVPGYQARAVMTGFPVVKRAVVTDALVAALDMPFASANKPLFYADTTGHYSGVITQTDGITPVANVTVALYQRSSNEVVRRARTNALGAFRFDGLYPGSNDYYAVALDPAGGILQNSLINDRIVPTSTFVPNTLSYIAGAMTIQDNALSCTMTIPPGTVAGDMLVACVGHGSTVSAANGLVTSGGGEQWLQMWTSVQNATQGWMTCDMLWKQATAANIAAGTITFTKTPTGPFCGQLISLRSVRGYPRIFTHGGQVPYNSAFAAVGNYSAPVFATGAQMGYNQNTFNTPPSIAIVALANWPLGTGLFDTNCSDILLTKTSPGPTQYKRLDTFVKLVQPGESPSRINAFTSTGGTAPGYAGGWPTVLLGGLFQASEP